MDKNKIIGYSLMAVVFVGFILWSQPSAEEIAKQKAQHYKDSVTYVETLLASKAKLAADTVSVAIDKENSSDFFKEELVKDSLVAVVDSSTIKAEQIVSLQNKKVKIDFSTKGGQILNAQLKNTKKFDGDSLYLFHKEDASMALELTNKQGQKLNTSKLDFTVFKQDAKSLVMRYSYAENQYIDFIYTLSADDYMMKYDINIVGMQALLKRESADIFELHWSQRIPRQEKSIKNEQKSAHLYYKYIGSDVEKLSEIKNEELEAKEATKWIGFKDQFFGTVLIADTKFETALLTSTILQSDDYLKAYSAKLYIPADVNMNTGTMKVGLSYYLGPMKFSHLKQYDEEIKDVDKQLDLDQLVPLGWSLFRFINQYLILPLFSLLSSIGFSIGIVILLLTIIVKIVISPLTYKSFMSSAKMRVLRPQIDILNAQYPNKDQGTERQQATMALYSKAGVNPMSGCIPMLLQMPILIALFQFFPNAIELRQQSFLWAPDLSTFDAIYSWVTPLPWIGTTHISLFCILMTITNIVYTKFNMEMTNTGQQQMPGMKWMMYLMPVIFLFMLNDYPSGLTYYYFLSLLMTIILTLVFRFAVNEEKLLAKLEANKSKPKKKKSGFMARLEEAQRMQQKELEAKKKKGNKKK